MTLYTVVAAVSAFLNFTVSVVKFFNKDYVMAAIFLAIAVSTFITFIGSF